MVALGRVRIACTAIAQSGTSTFMRGEFMRAIRLVSVTLSMLLTLPVWAAAPAYKIIDRIKIGDGRFDYAVFDEATDRVYMSRSFNTTVIDVKTNKVSQLDSAANGHMTLPIP